MYVLVVGNVHSPSPLLESGKMRLWSWSREVRSDCWNGGMLGGALLFWNSFFTWVVKWSRRSMIVGGMSASDGVQVDFTYSFDI